MPELLTMATPISGPGGTGTPPDVVALRPEHEDRQGTAVVGMVIFLGSWAIMFAAFFFVFAFYRIRAEVWPPLGFEDLPIILPTMNTGVMLVSSAVLTQAMRMLRQGNATACLRWVGATLGLGLAFVALQALLWSSLFGRGIVLDTELYSSFLFFLTGFHGLHVLVGLGLLGWLAVQLRRPAAVLQRVALARIAALFWHFVDAVWLVIFLLVFVL